ncbi:MAG: hypothetical protein JXB05_19445 [Myxococcaceae bacterium]|nr:hypothetical protein [Myxococcaceae bacterium]
MKTLSLSLRLLLCAVLFGAASGCVVDFPDELPYACEADEDCGGKGYICAALPDTRRYCCLPEPELCNRLDDDCNGSVDDLTASDCYTGPEGTKDVGACRPGKPVCGSDGNVLCIGQVVPTDETCNGKDDNCNGAVDETFDFRTGHDNCGRCDQVCGALQDCMAGECVAKRETACANTTDDDEDTKIDCEDTDCTNLPCGEGCVCLGGVKAEGNCGNTVDDEGDGPADCADTDCNLKSCGAGCICINNVRGEGDCGNGADDEGDGPVDCADSDDCTDKACGDGCVCRGGAKTEDLCDDSLDNDGDGTLGPPPTNTDCQDADCTGKSCGVGCVCESLGRKEVLCSDGLDNDGDTQIDCADAHCNNVECVPNETGARCKSNLCAENRCNDSLDNDNDGKSDCQDSDCAGLACRRPNGSAGTCSGTTCQ